VFLCGPLPGYHTGNIFKQNNNNNNNNFKKSKIIFVDFNVLSHEELCSAVRCTFDSNKSFGVIKFTVTHYRPAMPFRNGKIYFRGSF